MNLHPPILLIQREDGLYVEGYETPEPKYMHLDSDAKYNAARIEKWLSTKKSFKVKDEIPFAVHFFKLYNLVYFEEVKKIFVKGIDISSLADRIELVYRGFETYEATLKPLADPTIKPVTNCPTCGCECTASGSNEGTHSYVPKLPEGIHWQPLVDQVYNKMSKSELVRYLKENYILIRKDK